MRPPHPRLRVNRLLVAAAGTVILASCGSSSAASSGIGTAIASAAPPSGHIFSVIAYGAKGDGQTDNSAAFSLAVAAAEQAGGGTVYVPAGQYVFGSTGRKGASIIIQGTSPVVLMGAGRDSTTLIETKANRGLLGVHADGSSVQDLTLDTQAHDGGSAIFVQANHTSLLHSRVLGGPRHFALYYAGPPGAKPFSPLYNVGNSVQDVVINDLDCNDGFSWSFQQGGTISDITHTGSRLALYVDRSTTVSNYSYMPGTQQCGARNGFWITPPSADITITGFTSSGEGGKIGVIAAKGAGKVAANVTIIGETMTDTGSTLTIGDVSNLRMENCNLGTNNIVVNAVATAQATLVACEFGHILRAGNPGAQVALSVVPG